MSPAGAAPSVPAVAPRPSARARPAALAGLRPMTSTSLPPWTARAPRMRAIVPAPMMLTLLMVYLLPVAFLQSLAMPASDSPG